MFFAFWQVFLILQGKINNIFLLFNRIALLKSLSTVIDFGFELLSDVGNRDICDDLIFEVWDAFRRRRVIE